VLADDDLDGLLCLDWGCHELEPGQQPEDRDRDQGREPCPERIPGRLVKMADVGV
jgi:hypothetical protein